MSVSAGNDPILMRALIDVVSGRQPAAATVSPQRLHGLPPCRRTIFTFHEEPHVQAAVYEPLHVKRGGQSECARCKSKNRCSPVGLIARPVSTVQTVGTPIAPAKPNPPRSPFAPTPFCSWRLMRTLSPCRATQARRDGKREKSYTFPKHVRLNDTLTPRDHGHHRPVIAQAVPSVVLRHLCLDPVPSDQGTRRSIHPPTHRSTD